jgi:hypothetical protein
MEEGRIDCTLNFASRPVNAELTSPLTLIASHPASGIILRE